MPEKGIGCYADGVGFIVVVAHVLKEENEDTRANATRIIMDLEVARIFEIDIEEHTGYHLKRYGAQKGSSFRYRQNHL